MTVGSGLVKMALVLMVTCFGCVSVSANDGTQEQSQALPCEAAEYRQLDFRLGQYLVTTASGQPAGRSIVERTLSGCLLLEHWEGAIAGKGLATMFFDRNENRWHLNYVADDGQTLMLEGKFVGDVIVFFGENSFYDFEGLHKISWSPIQGGGALQEWSYSPDKEKSWLPVFTGIYKRSHSPAH